MKFILVLLVALVGAQADYANTTLLPPTFNSTTSTPTGCPPPAPQDDIQALPGCTLKETLNKTFECMGPMVANFPYPSNSTQCQMDLDVAIACMSLVVQDCIIFDSNNNSCPSALSLIPGEIDPILKEIVYAARRIDSVASLKAVFKNLLNASDSDLAALDYICADAATLQSIVTLLDNLYIPPINIGQPICKDNQIVDDLIKWALDFAKYTLTAQTHRDICLNFDRFKSLLTDAVINRCYGLSNVGDFLGTIPGVGPFADLIQKAINIGLEFFSQVAIPGCEDVPFPTHLVCYNGTKVYDVNRTMIYSDDSSAILCGPNENCAMFRYSIYSAEGIAYGESGFCLHAGYAPNCTDLVFPGVTFSNCVAESCSDYRCAAYTQLPEVPCKEVPSNDIPLLSQCSLKKTLNYSFSCLGEYMGGLPFTDTQQCTNAVDRAIACGSGVLQHCLAGNCPSVLSNIPGVGQVLHEIIPVAQSIHDLQSLLRLLGLSETDISNIYYVACHLPGSPLPQELRDLFNQIPTLNLGHPICDDNNVVDDVIAWAVETATSIIEASDHQDVCTAFHTMRQRVLGAWDNRCSSGDRLEGFLYTILQGPYMQYVPIIMRGINIAREFMEQLEIPNCRRTNRTSIDCSRYYDSTSACGLRQAWLCDFASWKMNFVTAWLPQFRNFIDANTMRSMSYPPCVTIPAENLCRNRGALDWFDGADGCRTNYCTDHLYSDYQGVSYIWRAEYRRWKHFFEQYGQYMNPGPGVDGGCGAY